jgi:hypothetical protein
VFYATLTTHFPIKRSEFMNDGSDQESGPSDPDGTRWLNMALETATKLKIRRFDRLFQKDLNEFIDALSGSDDDDARDMRTALLIQSRMHEVIAQKCSAASAVEHLRLMLEEPDLVTIDDLTARLNLSVLARTCPMLAWKILSDPVDTLENEQALDQERRFLKDIVDALIAEGLITFQDIIRSLDPGAFQALPQEILGIIVETVIRRDRDQRNFGDENLAALLNVGDLSAHLRIGSLWEDILKRKVAEPRGWTATPLPPASHPSVLPALFESPIPPPPEPEPDTETGLKPPTHPPGAESEAPPGSTTDPPIHGHVPSEHPLWSEPPPAPPEPRDSMTPTLEVREGGTMPDVEEAFPLDDGDVVEADELLEDDLTVSKSLVSIHDAEVAPGDQPFFPTEEGPIEEVSPSDSSLPSQARSEVSQVIAAEQMLKKANYGLTDLDKLAPQQLLDLKLVLVDGEWPPGEDRVRSAMLNTLLLDPNTKDKETIVAEDLAYIQRRFTSTLRTKHKRPILALLAKSRSNPPPAANAPPA